MTLREKVESHLAGELAPGERVLVAFRASGVRKTMVAARQAPPRSRVRPA
ncbi:hypothetical protein G3I59_27680 [Amycolatopsis rubida]|uniref:Uncharacterized protein n=1 Tax=Amycolatopsis rubida TaxID=112413 RepID=A0A1I5RS24_9PSEU|nr:MULTISPECIES: hypothetical protein [Amycolatopsis]MYW94277.1 hypothetical protein [Amycolatopsis rubida]NEC59266.1 hypothetical protein [Amycolatopsis rubida]OAP21350.1 hypothetical protein A4R44_07868 [Amycolatopsis sp. M39]SFP61308.1 hypothetical protein SAMN05421854_10649 [Amycolatopsis rubida]